MAGRKSSFLLRARKFKEGERVELTHLESQSTAHFSSLDDATVWVRQRWAEWDAQPVEREDVPAVPAEGTGRVRRFWDNAWTSQGLRRGEALVLAAAVLVLAVAAGDPGVRSAVGDAVGATQLSSGASSTPASLIGFTKIHWTYTGGSSQELTAEIDGSHPGASGVKTLLPAPNGSMRVFCFNLQAGAKVALAWKESGTEANVQYLSSVNPSGSYDVANAQGEVTSRTYDCPPSYRDAAIVHIPGLTNRFLNTGTTTTSGGTEGSFVVWFFR